jgi:hypothetical protein
MALSEAFLFLEGILNNATGIELSMADKVVLECSLKAYKWHLSGVFLPVIGIP